MGLLGALVVIGIFVGIIVSYIDGLDEAAAVDARAQAGDLVARAAMAEQRIWARDGRYSNDVVELARVDRLVTPTRVSSVARGTEDDYVVALTIKTSERGDRATVMSRAFENGAAEPSLTIRIELRDGRRLPASCSGSLSCEE